MRSAGSFLAPLACRPVSRPERWHVVDQHAHGHERCPDEVEHFHGGGEHEAQFSRWLSGTEGVQWPKFVALMDKCGNDAPLMWMLHQRGYDLHSLRRRESELERENRELRERLAAVRVFMGLPA